MAAPELAPGWARRARRGHALARLGWALLMMLVLLALVGPLLWHYGYAQITHDLSQPPSLQHPLGTDGLGRDMLAQVMRGLHQSLMIAVTVAVLASVIGTGLGVVAGYFGGWVDTAIMRLVDLVLTIPILAVAAFLGNRLSQAGVSWVGLALVLGGLLWTSVARLVRGVSLSLRSLPFIRAAQVMGASRRWIMLRHMLPNVAVHVIVATTLLVGVAILSETGLSFLGFGVRPPDTSLGLLIAGAQSARPWLFYAPGVTIVLILLAVNQIGEGMRGAVDPRSSAMTNPLRSGPRRRAPRSAAGAGRDGPLLSVSGLTVRFPGRDQAALENVQLDLARGKVLALVGESGSGKSLTALAIAGLLPTGAVATGGIVFDGQDLVGLNFNEWRTYRGRRIAVIPQDPSTSLNPVQTIGAQFTESLRLAGPISARESRRRAIELMRLMAISDPALRFDQYPHQLSGGMRQRVVIAMAMIFDPDLIIADEPTTALDVTVQAQVLGALRTAREKSGAAMLFITHDLALVAGIADEVAVMRAGRIVERQDVFALFAAPRDAYTARLLRLAPRLERSGITAADPVGAPLGLPLLKVEDLARHFSRQGRNGAGVVTALSGINFELARGETLGIVGESGSGKTTLLSTILGLHRPSAGRILFEGAELTPATRRAASRHLAVVFQDPYSSLDPRMTVAQLLEEPMHIHGDRGRAAARADQMRERVGLARTDLRRFPHEFSGGQRQRIAIARALMLAPRLLLLDEPVSALDVSIQQDILELLRELKRDSDVAYLLVTHDIAVVAGLSDRIGVMRGGHMVELGPTARILEFPSHPYTRSLMQAVPVPDPVLARLNGPRPFSFE
jgi:peptide/nickel transport system permease protein